MTVDTFGSDCDQNVRMVIKRNSPQKQFAICHCYFSPTYETLASVRGNMLLLVVDSENRRGRLAEDLGVTRIFHKQPAREVIKC